jgi:arylsulfatase A-like enzyme
MVTYKQVVCHIKYNFKIMKKKTAGFRLLLLSLNCLIVIACTSVKDETTDTRPNFLLIVADDAGYSDVSCYGGEIPTPNIDALANTGLQLTDFHVAPNCAPTRSALLSGMDNHLAGLGTMYEVITENQKGQPGYEGYLNFNVVSLAEVLQQSGYNTYMAGKWHLGAKKKETRPHSRGFDRTFSMLAGGASHWQDNTPLIPGKPSPYSVNGKVIKELPDDFYSSKNYADSIISFIDSDVKNDKPFFAYLSFTAPHNPLHAPKEYIEKYKGKYNKGWEDLAKNRLKRLKELNLIPEDQISFAYPEWLEKWDNLTDEQKASRSKDMEVYAAMIDYMDMSIGRVIEHLKSTNQYENTMIVFISDNGASKTTIMDYASLGGEVETYLKTFDNSIDNKGLPHSATDIGPAWAWAANTPFRMTKGYPTEGGMRVPCIVKMPDTFKVVPKKMTGFAYVSDLMPTFLELAKTEHPSTHKGHNVLPMQGISLLPEFITNQSKLSDREFGFEIYGMLTYRSGSWKINKLPVPYGTGKWQLYNLQNDLSEQTDLADKNPDKLNELIDKYTIYATQNGIVVPDRPVGYAKPPKENSY